MRWQKFVENPIKNGTIRAENWFVGGGNMRRLVALLLTVAIFLTGCTLKKEYTFDSQIFVDEPITFDAVAAIYTKQDYIKNIYPNANVSVLEDGVINTSQVMFAKGELLYLYQSAPDGNFLIGSYHIKQKKYTPIASSKQQLSAYFDNQDVSLTKAYGLIDNRYLIFGVKLEQSGLSLCSFDTTMQTIKIIGKNRNANQVVLVGKSLYFIGGDSSLGALVEYNPVSQEIKQWAEDCGHLIVVGGSVLYLKTSEMNEFGPKVYYTTEGRPYQTVQNMGLLVSGSSGLVASDVTINELEYGEIKDKFPKNYQTLPFQSTALAVTAEKGTLPILLPVGDNKLLGVHTDGAYVGVDMSGDYLPRFYDSAHNCLVIVGQLTGHEFSYETIIDKDYLYLVTKSTYYDGVGNATAKQRIFAVEKASLQTK